MYMNSPLFKQSSMQRNLPRAARNKPWMKLDPVEVYGSQASILVTALSSLVSDLRSPFAFVAALNLPGKAHGSESISGVGTTRYETDANLAQHPAGFPGFVNKTIKLAGPKWKARVWVDDNSLIRRVEFTSAPTKFEGNSFRVQMTCDLFQLGRPIKVNVPRASQVFDTATLKG
jgi:hypothetical protein